MERSRNSEPGEASSSVNDNDTRRQYYLKVTELPPQISEQELRHYFQDPKQFTGKPIERVDWNPQTQMAVIFFSDPDDVLHAVKQSPLVMKGKRICVEMGSIIRQEKPQEEVRTVKVKGLQADELELSLLYFENPKKGGGDIQEHRWDEAKKTLYITFTDAKVAEHLANSSPSISGKTLDVTLHNPQSEEDNSDHSDQCTVEVRGFDPSKVQVYEMYFQNPNKGGGDIANLVVNEDNTVMYVTFQTHEVAERVAMKSHTVSGLELRVKLAPQTSTVMITNCDVEKEELYKAYFENPKYGGGDIKEMNVDRALQIIYITFEDIKVAQQVAKSSHRISGLELQVRLAPQTSTVMVTNCDVENEDLCKMYFENPKYGGGDIQEIIVDKKLRAIYITFEDPEVAAAVCAKRHTMKGQELEVKLQRTKPSGQKLKVSSAPEKKEETTLTGTIEVTVGNQLQSDDTYLYYFENKRYGGGEVKKFESDKEKGLIHVTFVDHEVAEQIVNRQHTINGQTVDVKLYIPPKSRPTYKNRLLMENVKETNEGSLLLFIEYVTGCEPAEVVYGEMPGVILASFKEELDFTNAEKKCQMRTLAGNRVSVSKVPISNCLLVENLNPITTEDTLAMYFENTKRSHGGPVERVEMVTGENKCLIYFADYTVIDGVLTKTHTIDNNTLTLKHYFECLGPSGGSLDGNTFILPKPLEMKDIDPCKIAFVNQSSKAQNDFMHLLSRCHAVPKFTENSVIVECTLKPSDSNARTLAKNWPQDVLQAVNKCLDLLDVHRLEIPPENWVQVDKSVNSISLENKDDAICFVQPHNRLVVVVGFKSMAKDVFQQVSRTVKFVEDEVNRKSKEIKETKSVTSFKLRLLDATSFQTEAERKHNGVKVEICLQKGEITFQGMLKDVKEAQIAMFNILSSIKSDTITEMSTLQEDLLDTKETCEFIVDALKSEKITAVWEHVQKAVIVYAFSDADLEKAVHIIRTSVVQHIHPLTTESTHLLQSKDWLTLEQTLLDAHEGKLKITPFLDLKQIVITGTNDILNGVLQEVQQFMQNNAVYTEVYSFSPSRQKFIVLHWKEKILSMANTLKAYKMQVTIDKDGGGICVRSTEKGLQMTKAKLKELGEKILCHVETVREPTKVKFLSSDSCTKELDTRGYSYQCIVGFKEECTDLQVVLSSGQKGRNTAEVSSVMKTVQSVQLAKSVTVSVVHGDITQLSVDILVNAANSRMDHLGGLAKHIVDIGGKSIQEESHRILKSIGPELPEGEVLMTGAGQLPCKAIIHAVGPMYRGGRMRERQRLFDTVMICLERTHKSGYTSIAIPALSTGIFNYPVDESTSVVVEAVSAYIERHRRNTIREIYLCDIDLDTVRHFCKALQTVNTERSSNTLSMPSFESVINKGHNTVDIIPKPTNHHSNISISILAGEIAKQKADVIVNSSSNGLDLSNGAVSRSILEAAGSGLQDECKAKYPKGIQIGEIARTSAYRLDCKEVFHIALCNFSSPNAQQALHYLVTVCLREASNSGYTSIAFPALGTGVLRFPRDVVASNILGAIHRFQETTPATTLREVKVVVFNDTDTIQEFKAVISNLGMCSATRSASIKRTPTQRANRKFETSSEQSVQSGAVEFEIFGLRLFIKQGDITEEKVDAIVNSTNAELDLNRGAVASALRTKCGDKLVNDCINKVPEIKATGVITTKAYTLKCKDIIHVNGDRFRSQWEEGIVAVLDEAEKVGARTLAIPALGTGAYGRSPSECARDMFRALTNFFSGQRRLLQELHVVLFDRSMIPPFVSTFQSLGEKQKDNKSGFKGYAAEVKTSTLYVYAASEGNIKAFLAAFGELVNDTFTRKEISDEALSWISQDQIMEFKRDAKKFGVDIQIHPLACRLVMVGLRNNVFELTQKIFQSLRQEHRTKQDDKTASVLVNMVQWCFIEVSKTGTELKEYGGRENHKIETAYQNKEKTAEIKDVDGNVYVIDFDLMKEYPQNNPSDQVDVTRKDKIKAGIDVRDIPKFWTPHNPDEHVKLVPLQPTDSEYQTVEKNFRSTLGPGGSNLKITVIERVQNPVLYCQYQAKKAQLEKQNPGIQNEKILWHGTSVEALSNINNYGFNRSYCGKNATFYGEGVYFAVNSQYSASPTYSPPDPNTKKRYIYQCMVLTGYKTQGDQTLRFLPPRSGPILFDSATDNNVSPAMFVIFNDTQAYPGYMITFQERTFSATAQRS